MGMTRELQDKAWAVLPKEFREEVRNFYKSEYVSDRGYQPTRTMECLARLFGEHNLISDAEPRFKYSVGQKVILTFLGGEKSTITEAFTDGGVWPKYKVAAFPHHEWTEYELEPCTEPKTKGDAGEMKREEYEPLIRRTLAGFDFGKVHEYMASADWTWNFMGDYRVPRIGELYQEAERILIRAAKEQCNCSSGGLQAYSDGASVELGFCIEESGCTIHELEEN